MSLAPPYFQTQGGLQKYVGGATSDVTGVRGLARLRKESSLGSCTLLFYQQRFFLNKSFYVWRAPAGWCVWVHINCIYFTSAEHRGELPPVELNIHFSIVKSFHTGKYLTSVVFKATFRSPGNTFIAYKYVCVAHTNIKGLRKMSNSLWGGGGLVGSWF